MTEKTVRVLTSGPSHFFGFHDLTPWNAHSNELVCLRTHVVEDHIPTAKDEADVVVVDEASGRETVVGTTRAWNWQQAARQRWLPALGRRVIAYNAASPTGFECRITDLDRAVTRVLPMALYDICDQGGFGLALNFERIFQCQPGYGYEHVSVKKQFDPENDGLFRVDLETGESRLIIRLADFLRSQKLDMNLGDHYFSHLQLSPDGKRCAFVHRCYLSSGGLANHFIVANCDGSGYQVLLDDKASHFDWLDSDRIVIWCRKNSAIKRLKESKFLSVVRILYRISRKIRFNKFRQGFYNEAFRIIDVNTKENVVAGKGLLSEDGHPQVNPKNSDVWINDTYPNPEHIQTLMLYHLSSNRRIDLIRLPTQPSVQETCWRCDFHPRWNPNGRAVCVDSAHLGRRQICVLDVSEEIKIFQK